MIYIDGLRAIRTKLASLHEPSGVAALTREEAAPVMAEALAVITAAQNVHVALVAHFSAQGTITADGATNAAGWLRSQGLSGMAARRTADAARAVAAQPAISEAMRSGSLSVDHAASLADLAERSAAGTVAPAVVEGLLTNGAVEGPDAFRSRVQAAELTAESDPESVFDRKRRASRVKSFVDDNGMGVIHAAFDPERHRVAMAHIDAVVDHHWRLGTSDPANPGCRPATRDLGRLRADALYEILTSTTNADAGHPAPARVATKVVAHIDLETLRSGLLTTNSVCRLDDGTSLTPETVRRLACEAELVPLVLGGKSEPLDVGRGSRLATPAQRLSLEQQSATCEFPGCDIPSRWTKVHHINPWQHGGQTDLCNLCLICERHHHCVHEGGWTLTRGPTGLIQVRRPNGQLLLTPD